MTTEADIIRAEIENEKCAARKAIEWAINDLEEMRRRIDSGGVISDAANVSRVVAEAHGRCMRIDGLRVALAEIERAAQVEWRNRHAVPLSGRGGQHSACPRCRQVFEKGES